MAAGCSTLACSGSGHPTVTPGSRSAGQAASTGAQQRTNTTEGTPIIGTTPDLGCRYLTADEVSQVTGAKITNAIPGGNPSTGEFSDLPKYAMATCQWQTELLPGWDSALIIDTTVRQFPDAASAAKDTSRRGTPQLLFDRFFDSGSNISIEIKMGGSGPGIEALANKVMDTLEPLILARVQGTTPLAPPPAGTETPGTVAITDANIDNYQQKYAGTWSGLWTDDTFGTTGSLHFTIGFDKTAKTVSFDLRIDGKLFGGKESLAEIKRTDPLTSIIGVQSLDDPAGKVAWRLFGGGNLTVLVSNLADHPDVSNFQFSANPSDNRIAGTFAVSFTNNTTANGTWNAARG